MTYRHLGFLIFLFYQGVISYSRNSSGDNTVNFILHKSEYIANFNRIFISVQDTAKPKSANSGPDLSSDLEIQVGAFLRETNAAALKQRLSDLLNHKVVIVQANGYYKVRITGCKTIEEMGKLIESLGFLGIKNVWVFHNRPMKELIASDSVTKDSISKISISKGSVNKDTVGNLIAEKNQVSKLEEEPPPVNEPTINLQVGVFHSKAEALKAKRIIKTKLKLPVEIVREWEYYIVFITGFKTREEIFIYYPKLAALGYPDSFMFDKNKPTEK